MATAGGNNTAPLRHLLEQHGPTCDKLPCCSLLRPGLDSHHARHKVIDGLHNRCTPAWYHMVHDGSSGQIWGSGNLRQFCPSIWQSLK